MGASNLADAGETAPPNRLIAQIPNQCCTRFSGCAQGRGEVMWRRRELYGFSYYVVSDMQMEEFASVVSLLSGK